VRRAEGSRPSPRPLSPRPLSPRPLSSRPRSLPLCHSTLARAYGYATPTASRQKPRLAARPPRSMTTARLLTRGPPRPPLLALARVRPCMHMSPYSSKAAAKKSEPTVTIFEGFRSRRIQLEFCPRPGWLPRWAPLTWLWLREHSPSVTPSYIPCSSAAYIGACFHIVSRDLVNGWS